MIDIDRNAPCPCGSTKKYKHCCQRKEKAKGGGKSHPQAAMVPAWLQLGMQHLRASRYQSARAMYEQILLVSPGHVEALAWLGVVCHHQGNSEKAVELIQQSIALRPSNAQFHNILGNVLQSMRQTDEAILSYRQAISITPNFAEAHNNLGIALVTSGQPREAVNSYQLALQFVPNYAEAYNNLGVAFEALKDEEKAINAYKQAVTLAPNYGQAQFNLGRNLSFEDPCVAQQYLRRSVQLDPNCYEAWAALYKVECDLGQTNMAQQALQGAMQVRPNNGLLVMSALMLPPIMGIREEVLASRLNLEAKLDSLISGNITLDPQTELGSANFFLAYHGLNDKALLKKIAGFYEQACPSLLYVAPHCGKVRTPSKKKRIGFLSRFIAKHSVASSFSRIVESLSSSGEFEVALISSSDTERTSIKETYANFSGKYVHLSTSIAGAREQVAELELDVLLYLDIGMDPFTYFLAFARLATVQCVVGGHPVTTGIGAMDYYISSEIIESENAQDHYSEKLIPLSFGIFYFSRPQLPTTSKTRAQLGLPPEGRIYLCPVVLFKLHPDFDAAIEQILLRDSEGYVVLVADKKHPTWQALLEYRFDRSISDSVRNRLKFIPWVRDPLDFARVCEAADVVLDSFHFGIGTTGIPICAVGTPIVTKPSEFMRGRVGLFYCKVLDLMECVAADTDSYAAKAVSIATNPSERERIKRKMLENNHVIYENEKAIQDLSNFLMTVDV